MITIDDFRAYCLVHRLILWEKDRLDKEYGPQEFEGCPLAAQYAESANTHPIFAAILKDDGTVDVMSEWDETNMDVTRTVTPEEFCSGVPCHVAWE